MNFFFAFLRKLEPSREIAAYSAAICRKVPIENGRRWRFAACSLSQYRALFAVITSTEVWNHSIGEEIVCFAEEENSHRRKAVISTSDDISKPNIASELSSGASTVVKHCSRGVYSHYALPRGTAHAEIRGSAEL